MMLTEAIDQLSAQECRAELASETDLDRLRALVGLRRLLEEMKVQGIDGKVEGDVQRGKVRHLRYPRQLKVS